MRWLSDLSNAIDGTAILVHHPGWSDSGRTRGDYQFEANADEVLVFAGVAEGSHLLSLTRKKVKAGPRIGASDDSESRSSAGDPGRRGDVRRVGAAADAARVLGCQCRRGPAAALVRSG